MSELQQVAAQALPPAPVQDTLERPYLDPAQRYAEGINQMGNTGAPLVRGTPSHLEAIARALGLAIPGRGGLGAPKVPGARPNAMQGPGTTAPGYAASRQAAPPFDPHAFAQQKGLTYQGETALGPKTFHEFRDNATRGNFMVRGPLTSEAVEAALADHLKRWGLGPRP